MDCTKKRLDFQPCMGKTHHYVSMFILLNDVYNLYFFSETKITNLFLSHIFPKKNTIMFEEEDASTAGSRVVVKEEPGEGEEAAEGEGEVGWDAELAELDTCGGAGLGAEEGELHSHGK